MSFQWPLLLPLLAIVPLSVAAYVALERRRAKYAVRFTNLEVLAGVVDERRAWRRWLPPVLFFMALAAALLALTPAGSDGRRPQREGKRHPHHRQLGLDVREGRASHAARGCPGSRAAVPRQAPRSLPGRRRDVLLGGPGRRAADARPPGRTRRRRLPVPGTRDGDRRRAREVRRARAEQASGRALGETDVAPAEEPADDDPERPATAILLLSDGAQTAGILQPFEGAQRATTAKIPVYTVALGTPDGHGDVRPVRRLAHDPRAA